MRTQVWVARLLTAARLASCPALASLVCRERGEAEGLGLQNVEGHVQDSGWLRRGEVSSVPCSTVQTLFIVKRVSSPRLSQETSNFMAAFPHLDM